MYNYIFWVIYQKNINSEKGKWLSKNNASGVVFFSILVHVALIFQLSKTFFGVTPALQYITTHKGLEIIIGLLCIGVVYLFYSENQIAKLEEKYANNEALNDYGGWVVFLVIFIPLILIIVMGWKG